MILKELGRRVNVKLLRKPLTSGDSVHGHQGIIEHTDIIGKRATDVVTTSRGNRFMICEPTLAEYVTLAPRLVAPVRHHGF